jgi:hypothetical protein
MSYFDYFIFVVGFMVIHTIAYVVAGAIALQFSGELYREKARLIDFTRDMSNEEESPHVEKYFFPAQLVRGFLMAVVLLPILDPLGDISFILRFAFFAGIMIIYADLASANPFSHNIEGFVYLKEKYLDRKVLPELYFETFTHGILFGILSAWLLF